MKRGHLSRLLKYKETSLAGRHVAGMNKADACTAIRRQRNASLFNMQH
jgi:hypothetical protein